MPNCFKKWLLIKFLHVAFQVSSFSRSMNLRILGQEKNRVHSPPYLDGDNLGAGK